MKLGGTLGAIMGRETFGKGLKTRLERRIQYKGPQEFEASIDRIVQDWRRGPAGLSKPEPSYDFYFGEGTHPSYLQYISVKQSDPDARRIVEFFQEGHDLQVKGEFRAEWSKKISAIISYPLLLRDVYDAQIVVKNKESGDIIKTYDVDFMYVYPDDVFPDVQPLAYFRPAYPVVEVKRKT